MDEEPMTGPLHGIKVLEIGQALAGPLAGVILADMGADVIKVEKPDGGDDARLWGPPFIGDDSVMFHNTNRGKKSVTLDIKNPADIAKLKKLAGEADILIQNLRPGIVDDFGIGPETMTAEFPRLIYCSIWAFGHTGPMKLAPGFDPLLQSYGAVVTMTGRPEDPPTFCAPAINDTATGMWCVIGALAALQRRAITGRGGMVDASLFESAVAWVQGALNNYNVTGKVPQRHGTGSNLLTPYQIFKTSDRPICIAAGNDRLFVKLAKAMGHPEWCDDPRMSDGRKRAANRSVVVDAMTPVLATRTRQEWIGIIGEAGVPCCAVNDIAELAETEQLRAMDMLRTLPGSGLKVVGLPISFERERPYPRSDSPKLGEHNAEVFPGMTDELLYEASDGIGRITFNRPQARNALTFPMYERLAEIAADPGDVRVLILTGAGEKAFAAGTDINQFRSFSSGQDALDYEAKIDRVVGTLERCRVPTVAAIVGACTGGGAAIAAGCDLRIAAANARFGFPIARTLGNCLSMSNIARLAALVGPARVTEMIFTARLYSAAEALGAGLVTEVLPDQPSLEARATELATLLAGHAPLTMRATKEALRRLRDNLPPDEDLIRMAYESQDFREGMDAFLTKRAPVWSGR